MERQADELQDPSELLRQFKADLDKYAAPFQQGPSYYEYFRKVSRTYHAGRRHGIDPAQHIQNLNGALTADEAATSFYTHWPRIFRDTGRDMFLSVLHRFDFAPGIKKSLEVAARFYATAWKPKSFQTFGVFDSLEKLMTTLTGHVELMRKALAMGKAKGEGAGPKTVGSFTVYDSGVGQDAVDEVSKAIAKAEALLKAAGFGKVCYGDVYVTNNVLKSNTAAFYYIPQDALYCRAGGKFSSELILTIIHELGHRLEFKMLHDKDGVKALYDRMSGADKAREKSLKAQVPKPGQKETLTFADGQKAVTIVKRVEKENGTLRVYFEVERPGMVLSIMSFNIGEYWQLVGKTPKELTEEAPLGFVTPYSKKSPSENFAELFSFYCAGKLPKTLVGPFEEVAFGGSKNAAAHRLVARHFSFVRK